MASALFLGAIGVIVETSDLQRRAFNDAFEEMGLDWYWSQEDYMPMLAQSGGKNRIERFAAAQDQQVDAAAVHAAKVKAFAARIREDGLSLRSGVRNLIDAAKERGMKLGFVTSTGADQSDAIFDALGDALSRDEFDYIGDASKVARSKPAPDIYLDALETFGLKPQEALAIEDSPTSADAAVAAGIRTLAYPGAAHTDDVFPDGVRTVDVLSRNLLAEDVRAA